MTGTRRVTLGVALLALAMPDVASAQVPTVRPPGVAPTREELKQQLSPGVAPVGPPETGVVEEEKPAPATPLSETETYSFLLKGVDVENATVYAEADLRPIYEPFLDTQVTIGGLREIANRIERKYRDDGYVATRVIVPPQAISDGVATLEVFEGKIIHYEINGDIGPVKKQIARLLDNLLTGEPARWSELERYLLLARDLPGISLTGTLRSAGEAVPGGVILVVDTARKPIDGFVSLQNRNAEPTGPFTVSGGIALNSNTQHAERFGAVALTALDTPEQISGYLSYEQSFGDEGLRGRISAIQGFSKPGDALATLKLTTFTTIFTAELEYPIVRSRRFSLWTRGGVEVEDQQTTFGEDSVQLLDDQLRVLYAGAQGIWQPPLGGVMQFDISARQGLDDFGADANSMPNARPDFTLIRGEISHRQPIPPFFELYLDVRAQKSSKPLPTVEQMSLGELTIGRGFEPGSLVGDNGFATTAELRYFPPGLEAWWLNSFQVFTFVDYGRVDDNDDSIISPKGFEQLASAGFGVRFQVFDTLYGDLYYAQPVTRALSTATDRPKPGVFFSLTEFF